jgi:tetratricopeptide (TPR) repeat protein
MNYGAETNPPAWKIYMGMLPQDIGMLGAMPVFSASHSAWYARPPGYVRALRLPALAAPSRNQGLGDAAAFNQASIDLHNQIELPIQAGDTFLNAGDTQGALSAYKAAGQTAATTNGPQIDAAGAVSATQPLTQFALGLNGRLQAASDAVAAQGLAHQMLVTYQDAIQQGLIALANPPSSGGSPDAALIAAAQALSAYLQNHGVPSEHSSLPIVSTFQNAWNANGTMGAALVVDGKYGPKTASALAVVLGSAVPAPNTSGPPGPAVQPPAGGGSASVVVTPSSNTTAAWILGAALVGAAGIAGWAWYNKGGGKAMLTRRRARRALPRARARRRSR